MARGSGDGSTAALYRAVDDQELAALGADPHFAASPSGFGQKQFWLSLEAAVWYAGLLADLGYGAQTVLRIEVNPEVLSLGAVISLDGRQAWSLPVEGLGALNAVARVGVVARFGP